MSYFKFWIASYYFLLAVLIWIDFFFLSQVIATDGNLPPVENLACTSILVLNIEAWHCKPRRCCHWRRLSCIDLRCQLCILCKLYSKYWPGGFSICVIACIQMFFSKALTHSYSSCSVNAHFIVIIANFSCLKSTESAYLNYNCDYIPMHLCTE